MEIIEVDPFDEQGVRAWHQTYARSTGHGRAEWANPWQLAEVWVEMRTPGARRRLTGHVGIVDGEVVTAGVLSLPLLDNLTAAGLEIHTDPERRGHGFGSAMLAHLESLAVDNGRHLLNAEAFYPYDAPVDGSGHPNADFLTRRGFGFGIGDVHRVLDLPVDHELLDRLATEAAHASYRIEAWRGPVPEEMLESYVTVDASLMTEAPSGEIEREPEVVDLDAFREAEALGKAQGRTSYFAVALDGPNEVVALSHVVTSVHSPGRCFQWGTVVHAAHRGRRLGMAVKVANLRQLQDPSHDALFTYNAEVNSHMLAINDRLGFRPVERLGEFQKRLARSATGQSLRSRT